MANRLGSWVLGVPWSLVLGRWQFPPLRLACRLTARRREAGQALGLAEEAERVLRLRIVGDEVPAGVLGREERRVDLVADHRPDELAVLRPALGVERDARLVGDERLEVLEHRVLDLEVARDEAAILAAGDARVALRREALREVGEHLAAVQQATEARRVEALDRADHAAIRLDAAAAVDRAAAVGLLQLIGLVLARLLLIAV